MAVTLILPRFLPRFLVRHGLVWLHRYTGLVLAAFLVAAGLSGATLGGYDALDALTYPALAERDGPLLDPVTLAERVEAANPKLQIMLLPLRYTGAHALKLSVASRDPKKPLAYDEIFVDPRRGTMLGSRSFDGPVRALHDVMPFLYRFHYSLALGQTGSVVMGWVALAWTIDCFIGFLLTLPPTAGRGWGDRWVAAWLVRRRTTSFKLSFDLHRAAGLWLWPMLFVLAWSSVAMNLQQVYSPVMQLLLPTTPDGAARSAVDRRTIAWRDALAVGRHAMAREAARRGFAVREEVALRFIDWDGQLSYITRSSLDAVESGDGETAIAIQPVTGHVLRFTAPEVRRTGDIVGRWVGYLHQARVGGWAYDLLLALTGIAMAGLSITGIVIWWMKLRARRWSSIRHRSGGIGATAYRERNSPELVQRPWQPGWTFKE